MDGRRVERLEELPRRLREVALLVGEGCSRREIAERLYISEATVRNHIHAIVERVGIEHSGRAGVKIALWVWGQVSEPQIDADYWIARMRRTLTANGRELREWEESHGITRNDTDGKKPRKDTERNGRTWTGKKGLATERHGRTRKETERNERARMGSGKDDREEVQLLRGGEAAQRVL